MIFVKYHKLFLWLACILTKFSYNMAVLCICINKQLCAVCVFLSCCLSLMHTYIHLTYLMCIMGRRKYHNVKNWNEKLRSNDDIFAPDQNSKQIDSSSYRNVPWCTLHRVFETIFCMHTAYSPFLLKFK